MARMPQALGERDGPSHVHTSRGFDVVVVRSRVVPPKGRRAQGLQVVDHFFSVLGAVTLDGIGHNKKKASE